MKLKKVALLCLGIALLFPSPTEAQNNGIALNETEAWFYPAGNCADGKTVLILPGGGYSYHAMQHEGHDWVPFFNAQGINVAVLKYRLPEGNPAVPLNDVKKTMEILLDHAQEWNINPNDIGIMGFSAGGHLASCYANHTQGTIKPAFQILFYPVISLKSELTHQGSKDSFLGSDQSEERIKLYSGEEQVTSTTPPAIIFHSCDDPVDVENSVSYFRSLKKAGIPVALHIYPDGGHGWGIKPYFPYHNLMLEELSTWLKK